MSTLTTKINDDAINSIILHSTNLSNDKDIYNNYWVSADNGLYSNSVMGV